MDKTTYRQIISFYNLCIDPNNMQYIKDSEKIRIFKADNIIYFIYNYNILIEYHKSKILKILPHELINKLNNCSFKKLNEIFKKFNLNISINKNNYKKFIECNLTINY